MSMQDELDDKSHQTLERFLLIGGSLLKPGLDLWNGLDLLNQLAELRVSTERLGPCLTLHTDVLAHQGVSGISKHGEKPRDFDVSPSDGITNKVSIPVLFEHFGAKSHKLGHRLLNKLFLVFCQFRLVRLHKFCEHDLKEIIDMINDHINPALFNVILASESSFLGNEPADGPTLGKLDSIIFKNGQLLKDSSGLDFGPILFLNPDIFIVHVGHGEQTSDELQPFRGRQNRLNEFLPSFSSSSVLFRYSC